MLKVKRGLADGLPNLYAFVHAEPKEKPASSTVERGDAEWPWFEAPADTSFGDGKTDAALKYRWGGGSWLQWQKGTAPAGRLLQRKV